MFYLLCIIHNFDLILWIIKSNLNASVLEFNGNLTDVMRIESSLVYIESNGATLATWQRKPDEYSNVIIRTETTGLFSAGFQSKIYQQ